MNEIFRSIALTGLVLALGLTLLVLSAFLLRFLYKPWVFLILSIIGVMIVGLIIKRVEAMSG